MDEDALLHIDGNDFFELASDDCLERYKCPIVIKANTFMHS